MTVREQRRLQVGEMKFVRAIKGETRRHRVRNADLLNELKMESLQNKVEKISLLSYGHIKRRKRQRIQNRMDGMKIYRKRPKRPRRG